MTADLRGALSAVPEVHYTTITEPKQVGELLQSISDTTDWLLQWIVHRLQHLPPIRRAGTEQALARHQSAHVTDVEAVDILLGAAITTCTSMCAGSNSCARLVLDP